ncbi:MAG: hypothetical protein K2Q15_10985, partial [Burkholderiales bacterium]|nr:hypothetical protein [Burkholderiales bacterium]
INNDINELVGAIKKLGVGKPRFIRVSHDLLIYGLNNAHGFAFSAFLVRYFNANEDILLPFECVDKKQFFIYNLYCKLLNALECMLLGNGVSRKSFVFFVAINLIRISKREYFFTRPEIIKKIDSFVGESKNKQAFSDCVDAILDFGIMTLSEQECWRVLCWKCGDFSIFYNMKLDLFQISENDVYNNLSWVNFNKSKNINILNMKSFIGENFLKYIYDHYE